MNDKELAEIRERIADKYVTHNGYAWETNLQLAQTRTADAQALCDEVKRLEEHFQSVKESRNRWRKTCLKHGRERDGLQKERVRYLNQRNEAWQEIEELRQERDELQDDLHHWRKAARHHLEEVVEWKEKANEINKILENQDKLVDRLRSENKQLKSENERLKRETKGGPYLL